jgi:hypothetical protein
MLFSTVKKMFLLLGGTFLFSNICLAQISFTVKDRGTQQPIEYAQVALLRINQGASTNERGVFTLDNYVLTDSVIVSSLGYKSEKIAVRYLVANPVVYLLKSPVALNEVTVTASRKAVKFHRKRIGWFDHRVNRFINLSRVCSQKGARMVVWVSNTDNQVGIIEELIVKLLPRPDTKDRKPVLIRVCSLAGTQAAGPERDASITTTVFKVEPTAQTLHIDLRKSQLYLPATGGFVGIEWLESEYSNLPVCVAATNSDLDDTELSATWQSYRGKKWARFGIGYGADGKARRFSNSNARIDAVVAFPEAN